jgi:hypothetical protein
VAAHPNSAFDVRIGVNHAFGLPHTRSFADIMYGGDIANYFGRFRTQLKARVDIAKHSGISDADRVAFRQAIK